MNREHLVSVHCDAQAQGSNSPQAFALVVRHALRVLVLRAQPRDQVRTTQEMKMEVEMKAKG